MHVAYAFRLPCSLPASLPIQTTLRTVPRSPFVHKPSQENFIKKVHSRYFKIFDADLDATREFLDYISQNGIDGVRIKAAVFERKPLGFGRDMIAPKEGKEIEQSTQDTVKQMSEELVAGGFGSEEASEADVTSEKAQDKPE